MDSFSIP